MIVDGVSLVAGSTVTPITGFVWMPMGRWSSDPIYNYHRIPGAVKGRIKSMGKDSPRNVLMGRAPRTPANETVLSNMEGSVIEITSGTTTYRAYCTKVADADNQAWLSFRASLVML